MLLAADVQAGDILRGNAGGGSSRRNADARAGAGATEANVAKAKAQDRLARTSKAIQAVRNMQNGATSTPRVVPDGLTQDGLKVLSGANARWDGADAPYQVGNTVTVRQNQSQAVLHWETFNVGRKTTLKFDQSKGGDDAGKWAVFNKVFDLSGKPSQILGAIKAEGQVYVINQNGIIFGTGSQVNVRALVASTLPINEALIQQGLLNNPDSQFLFSALAMPAGSVGGMPAFIPPTPLTGDGKIGALLVETGAKISAPINAEGNGGRVMLVGPEVTNNGEISTPAGQTILAAGLQVGIAAHSEDDPSLRGLDIYIGGVGNYKASVTNNGLIYAPRGNVFMAGKSVNQMGAIDSSTSVSLNGRIDLIAAYDAVSQAITSSAVTQPFSPRSTGSVTLGPNSVTRILPEWSSTETVTGLELALPSLINIQGYTIHMGKDAVVLAPGARLPSGEGAVVPMGYLTAFEAGVQFAAGTYNTTNTFRYNAGQVYIDQGALIDVSGSTGVQALITQNIITLQLRGSELADSPLQRNGAIRGLQITVDLRKTGTYNGEAWVGTPLGDVSGYAGLIERTVGELTATGGTVQIKAGGSIVLRRGATIDVSGGWIDYQQGDSFRTSRLIANGQFVNIEDATPDRVYSGVYTGMSVKMHQKWGVTKTYAASLAPLGGDASGPYLQGADGGSIVLQAPSMAIDGDLVGQTITGPRQIRTSELLSTLPQIASLQLNFKSQDVNLNWISPTPPEIIFEEIASTGGVQEFTVDVAGNPAVLDEQRQKKVSISPNFYSQTGFGSLTIENSAGSVSLPAGVVVQAPVGGALSISASNIRVEGSIIAPGGSLSFTAYNYSPYDAALLRQAVTPITPAPAAGRGIFTLGSNAFLSVAGVIIDERVANAEAALTPAVVDAGSVSITGYSVNLEKGSRIDASGGMIAGISGSMSFGKGGAISIVAGQDPGLKSILGGKLTINATLSGFSAIQGGSLAIQAPLIQVGGTPLTQDTFFVQPEFFNQGGFTSFTLTGLGAETGSGVAEEYFPAVYIAPGTVIRPQVQTLAFLPSKRGGRAPGLQPVQLDVGERYPVSIAFKAPGVTDEFTKLPVIRGDIKLSEGASIIADPLATVSFEGQTVSILGQVIAPGGGISVTGAASYPTLSPNVTEAAATVYLGAHAYLSTAGVSLYTNDPFGRRRGELLAGGLIELTGNIVTENSTVLDVSGTNAIFDLTPQELGVALTAQTINASGVTLERFGVRTSPFRLESDGGVIRLTGKEMLLVNAKLQGAAGGPAAVGGTLEVSSGRFYTQGSSKTSADLNLIVSQNGEANPSNQVGIGQPLRDQAGNILPGMGYFAVSSFEHGGFSSLVMGGNVQFSGSITIEASHELKVATGGVIATDSAIFLKAPYVALGQPFPEPTLPTEQEWLFTQTDSVGTSSEYHFMPTHGSGSLQVVANLIDVGTLSLQGIGTADFKTNGGQIRGGGTFDIAGTLTMEAGAIYPVTMLPFNIFAYDYTVGGMTLPGTVTIQRSATVQAPLSAVGSLNIYASKINQGGVLLAPFGSISLGWDGTGTAPVDPLAGATIAAPVTSEVNLLAGSVTSVAGIDFSSGNALLIPYGMSADGQSWIDPSGFDITTTGIPEKSVTISGQAVNFAASAAIDIRGGGDLFAYQWVQGTGGSRDILASSSSFAIIPGYRSSFAPYGAYNTSSAATNLGGDLGYVNAGLSVGDSIYLQASSGLPAGIYTLLPARYALLPGAYLVTPTSNNTIGTVQFPDGSSSVYGYRMNSMTERQGMASKYTQFEVLPQSVVAERAEYMYFSANQFFTQVGQERETVITPLPADAGHLAFQAGTMLNLAGSLYAAKDMSGRGAKLDISATADIFITDGSTAAPAGTIQLSASQLTGYGVESLLIGGVRTTGTEGTNVSTHAANITVDNASSPLTATEVILVSKGGITLDTGANIVSRGPMTRAAEKLLLTGDGALLRISGDMDADMLRTGFSASSSAFLTIGADVRLEGTSLILDSSGATSLSPTADLVADAISFNSGRITVVLNNPGVIAPTTGLVLAGDALRTFESATKRSLLSYSSIDFYGTGQVGTAGEGAIFLRAGELRGFFQNGGDVIIAADSITLDNAHNASVVGAGALDGTLVLDTGTLLIGSKQVALDQFATTSITATKGVLGQGSGGVTAQGDMTIITPLITGGQAATQSITAKGALVLARPVGMQSPSISTSLGASLTLSGSSVLAATDVILPSGLISIVSTSGDVVVQGRLDVEGTAQNLFDVVQYTNAGAISISASGGDVRIESGALVSVSGANDGGDAGELVISAAAGTFSAANGTLNGTAASGYESGRFGLDVGSLGSLASLEPAFGTGDFVQERSFRVRTGDLIIDGYNQARKFTASTDLGTITVTGIVNAHGSTGGQILLQAHNDLILEGGSLLDASGENFDNAGKGGEITLAAGTSYNGAAGTGTLNIKMGSKIDLTIDALDAGIRPSSFYGQFSGILHVRAPQIAGGTDLSISPIAGDIEGASAIIVEGYQVFDLAGVGGLISGTGTTVQAQGGLITSSAVNVQESIKQNGLLFGGNDVAIKDRLFAADPALKSLAVISPGAEVVNSAEVGPITLTFGQSGASSVTVPSGGGTIVFPNGTGGNNMIRSSVAATIVSATGATTTLAANTPTSIPSGSSVIFSGAATVTYASGTSGAFSVQLSPGTSFTAGTSSTVATVSRRGASVSLVTPGTSGVDVAAGTTVLFTTGTPGTRTIVANVPMKITTATGTIINLAANTATTIAAGSTVSLSSAGRITYASSGSGSGTPAMTLLAGSMSTTGSVGLSAATGNLTLGTSASTTAMDWDLSTYRYGTKSAPGVLTLRASGNLVFYNTLSDGFQAVTPSAANGWSSMWLAPLMALNDDLPTNVQSWSFNLVAGADLKAANVLDLTPLASLAADSGSLQIGKNIGQALGTSGANATTARVIGNTQTSQNNYQVIRTGTGNINVAAGRDVQLLNQFATIYTAGAAVEDYSTIYSLNDFVVPVLIDEDGFMAGSTQGSLGNYQQVYFAQYSMAGGNVSVSAQRDIAHYTKNGSVLVADSSRQVPTNWLMRRSYVDGDSYGSFSGTVSGNTISDASASTTWWIDFSNFFEGVGALGGGNVNLTAGRDVVNVDAVAPTNARTPKGLVDPTLLLEYGGGDVTVTAGRNIDGGIYYVERGTGTLYAGGEIKTNSTRSPSRGIIASFSSPDILDSQTWLPTTLYLGKGDFNVSARGNVLLGPTVNAFLTPQGLTNRYWYKTVFSTYASDSSVDVSSLGGTIDFRLSTVLPDSTGAIPILKAWLQKENQLSGNATGAWYYPWIRLAETNVNVAGYDASLTVMAPSLTAVSFSGDINITGDMRLYPSSSGNLELLSAGTINGLKYSLGVSSNLLSTGGGALRGWYPASIYISDTSPSNLPGIYSSASFLSRYGDTSNLLLNNLILSNGAFLTAFNNAFAETAVTNSVIQVKQSLHDSALLHAGDSDPVKIYAVGGDVSDLTLYSPKVTTVLASNDIRDVAFYIQNVSADDFSLVQAGRDIILYDSTTTSLHNATSAGNILMPRVSIPAGDVQISGPGALGVFAGRDLDLGIGASNSNGTGTGITSTGNARNPYLPFVGADILAGAGLGVADSLMNSFDVEGFLETNRDISDKVLADSESNSFSQRDAASMSEGEKRRLALMVFFAILRDTGRSYTETGNYDAGFTAIEELIQDASQEGELKLRSRDVRTKQGGDINLLVPGGGLTMSSVSIGNPLTPPGVVTERGGSISIFTRNSVDLGIGRIFTLRGGDIVIWSSEGDIAAGSAAKTVRSAPPTRVIIDPQTATVETDLAGLATGGGIGVLASVKNVPPGDVDLIAPNGTVDAGDAGIRATGNLSIAAVQVLNADNIAVSGTTTGVPAQAAPAAPNIAGLSSASSSTGAATNTATEMANQPRQENATTEMPSIISVEVVGYGGGEDDS